MAATDVFERRCPECGAALSVGDTRCWLCHGQRRPEEAVNPYASPAPLPRSSAAAAQFSLSTLLLIMTLVAVCLGVTMAAPGLGIWLIVLATPALVRTMVAGFRQKQVGSRYTAAEKIAGFGVSLVVMAMIGVAAFAAFEAACWGTCALAAAVGGEGDPAIYSGVIAGIVVALGITGWLLWLTRPRKPKEPPGKSPPAS